MAILNGPLDFSGSIGTLTFYNRRDLKKTIVQQKTGPTRKQIRTDPRFAGTRRSCTEWDGCVTGFKWLHRILQPLEPARDYNYSGPLTGLLKPVQQMDTQNASGQRRVGLSHYPRLLEGFSISRHTPFEALLRTPMVHRLDKNALSGRVEVPAVLPGINFTAGTPHPYFRIVASLGVVPDLHYTPGGYAPGIAAGSYLPHVVTTEWTGTKRGMAETVLELNLSYPVEYSSFTLVLAVAILFGAPDALGNTRALGYSGSGRIAAVV